MMPALDIVVPCLNEVGYIEACVRRLLASEYDGRLRVIVVDGMSNDGTREVLAELVEEYEGLNETRELVFLDNPQRTTPYALNTGIDFGANENVPYVMVMGAHSEPSPDYARACVEALEARPECAAAGGLLLSQGEGALGDAIAVALSSPVGVGGAHFRTGLSSGYVDTAAFAAYRRSALNQVGAFDPELTRNQDDELSYRLLKAGWKIWLTTEGTCTYFVRGSFQKLQKQYFQYGYWKVYVARKHRAVTTLRQLAPAGLVAALGGGMKLAFLPIYYFILSEFGLVKPDGLSLWESMIPLGIVAFLGLMYFVIIFSMLPGPPRLAFKQRLQATRAVRTIHFAYGLGYWLGIWHFLVLRRRSVKQKAGATSR